MSRLNRIALSLFFVVAASAWFLADTVLADAAPDAVVVVVAAVGALVFSALVAPPSIERLKALSPATRGSSIAAGLMIAFVAPLLVTSHRLTDAPPGAEVLFFTTAGWGLIGIVVALIAGVRRPTASQVVFACIGVLGVAALVANWERPSSFSPLIRYPLQEYWFLVAGLSWAAGSVLLARALAEGDRRTPIFVASASAAIAAAIYAVVTSGAEIARAIVAEPVAVTVGFVAFGVMFVAWSQLLQLRSGLTGASALWFLPPIAVTALGVVEQATTPRGPDPVIWIGALGGVALCGVAAAGIWLCAPAATLIEGEDAPSRRALFVMATTVSALSAALGVVALALPAFDAAVSGRLSSGQAYDVAWSLLGFESAGGWAVALAGALLLTGVLTVAYAPRSALWAAVAGAGALIISYWAIASTPLHTWNRWIPTELQSEYGTEYVSLTFSTVHHPVRLAALAAAGGAALIVAGLIVSLSRRGRGDRSEVSS